MLYRFDSIDASDICFSSARRFFYYLAGDMKGRLSYLIFLCTTNCVLFISVRSRILLFIMIAASFVKKKSEFVAHRTSQNTRNQVFFNTQISNFKYVNSYFHATSSENIVAVNNKATSFYYRFDFHCL